MGLFNNIIKSREKLNLYQSLCILQLCWSICLIVFVFLPEFPQSGVQDLNKGMSYPDKENMYAQQIARTAEQYPETKMSMQ